MKKIKIDKERKNRYKEKVIYAKSLPELYEYFYFYRKLWQGQAIMRTKE